MKEIDRKNNITKLNGLFNVPGSTKKRKRVGRGTGSGTGKTCGRGEKGQKSRSGVSIKTEGGQMPIIKRLPKRGFNSDKSIKYFLLKAADLEVLISQKRIDSSKPINKALLAEIGLIKNANVKVKLLGGIESLDHKLSVEFDAYSESGRMVIEKAGGTIL